jgi:hypothetical protein
MKTALLSVPCRNRNHLKRIKGAINALSLQCPDPLYAGPFSLSSFDALGFLQWFIQEKCERR